MTANLCASCGKPTDATVCHADALSLAERLREAAGHAEDAWTVIARLARYGGAGGARKAEAEAAGEAEDRRRNAVTEFGWAASVERPRTGALIAEPMPYDDGASARLADVANVVTTWARHVCEERGTELPARRPLHGPLCDDACEHPSCAGIRRRRPPSALGEAAAWLATQVEWLRHRPEAREAFDELGDACRMLRGLVDRPASDRLVGVCDCGKVLYAAPGRREVQCPEPKCQLRWDVEGSREILMRHLDGQLVTVPEALDMAGWLDTDRTREQIRKLLTGWIKTGQVLAHGHVLRDPTDAELLVEPDAGPVEVPTYRFGEIRARLAATPRRNREGAAA